MSDARSSSDSKEGPVENDEIRLSKSEVTDSKPSVCSCGPECGPEKCEGRNRSALVGWDSLRSKIFTFLLVAFLVWLIIYVPLSLSSLINNVEMKTQYTILPQEK